MNKSRSLNPRPLETQGGGEPRASAHWRADRRSSATLAAAMRVNCPHPTVVVDEIGRVVSLNSFAKFMLDRLEQDVIGWTTEELLGFSIEVTSSSAEASPPPNQDLNAAQSTFSERARRRDGSTFPVEVTCAQLQLQERSLTIIHFCDVSARHAAETRLRQLSTALEQIADHAVITDSDGRILYVNRAFECVTGYSSAQVIGKTMSLINSGHHDAAFFAALWQTIRSGQVFRAEIVNRKASGDLYIDEQSISPFIDKQSGATYYIATGRDVSDRRLRDPLTGLPTRDALLARVEVAMARMKRSPNEAYFALIFIDLDRFKNVNDAHGNLVGDQVLVEMGNRIRQAVRDTDAVAQVSHLDRDEFAVLVEELQGIEDVRRIAQRLDNLIRMPIRVPDGSLIVVTASIGISTPTPGHGTPDAILQDAETAMRKAKSTPDEPCQMFDLAMHRRAQNRLHLESDLRAAISRDEFVLHYQPIVSFASGRITGCEALVRWLSPTRGFVSPLDFIEISEETGLIVPLGQLVLEKACRQTRGWHDRGFEDISVAVNVSTRQLFEEQFVDAVRRILEETRLEPRLLKIEITESAAARDPERVISVLLALKNLGISLLIDDFGTGHSSLSRITRFPLHKLKIDRSFVTQIPNSYNDNAIASTIVAMAHGLGLGVIAEGVETLDQAEFLCDLGCEEMQGYLFSKPVAASDFEQLLLSDKRLSPRLRDPEMNGPASALCRIETA